jgi:hypothetical protein
VQDPDDGARQQPTETLQAGSSRPPLFQKVPTAWRQHGVTFIGFVLGIAAGGGAMLWWQARPEPPPPFHPDEHAVELILFEAPLPRTSPSGRESAISPLQVDGAVLLSGLVTSTVIGIGTPDDSLVVRAAALPVTVSPTARYQAVNLKIIVRDCKAATRWTPVDRPFTITWRDEYGRAHLDRAGDFGTFIANTLNRYVDRACDHAPKQVSALNRIDHATARHGNRPSGVDLHSCHCPSPENARLSAACRGEAIDWSWPMSGYADLRRMVALSAAR